MPFGRVQASVTWPTGSLSAATVSMPCGHGLDPRGVERQAVEEGPAQPGAPRLRQVLGIGRQNGGVLGPQGRRHGLERLVFLGRRGERQQARRRARGMADIGHGRGDIAGAFDALERRGHRLKGPLNPDIGPDVLSRRVCRREIGRKAASAIGRPKVSGDSEDNPAAAGNFKTPFTLSCQLAGVFRRVSWRLVRVCPAGSRSGPSW